MKSCRSLLLIVLSAVLLMGCCNNLPASYPTNLVDKLIDSTVALVTKNDEGKYYTFCAGTWITPQVILTAAHCTKDTEANPIGSVITFKTKEEIETDKIHYAVVTSFDERRDLAIIKSIDLFPHAISIIASYDPPQGERVEIVGHTVGMTYTYLEGIISAYRIDEDAVQVLQISSPAYRGNSGGPAFNSRGELVGICSFVRLSGPNLTFFLSRETILKFLHDEKEDIK